ncbi:mucin-binding protein, partial [Streptococcus hyovaginalis]
IIYVPIISDTELPTRQTVRFEGAGDLTPADVVNSDFTFTGDKNEATGEITWNQASHTYGTVVVPVIPGYYADKATAGGLTVTPDNPEVVDVVTYKPLGNLVPKPENPNDPNFPDTPDVPYPNHPTDPTQPGQPVVPDVPGYKPHLPDPNDPTKPGQPITPGTPIPTPENPGEDTPIIYVPIISDTELPTRQTVRFEGAGDLTPADVVNSDFTFTGDK